jgi:hypothetical protein
MFQQSNLLAKYIYVATRRIGSGCTSRGRAIFWYRRKLAKVPNVGRRDTYTTVSKQGRTKFISYNNLNEEQNINVMSSNLYRV